LRAWIGAEPLLVIAAMADCGAPSDEIACEVVGRVSSSSPMWTLFADLDIIIIGEIANTTTVLQVRLAL
jgi:hypothetical protein